MKKIAFVFALLGLTACEAPYTRTVIQPSSPRVCVEYADSFRCSAPQRVWSEEVYPKNMNQMRTGYTVQRPYRQSLSHVLYGTEPMF